METIEVTKSNAIKAYKTADDSGKKLLSDLLGEKIFSQTITDRVKTFEDACGITGDDPEDDKFITGDPDDIAYQKIKVIVKALNEGVVLSFANSSQRKWYPWFEYSASGFRFNAAHYVYTITNSTGGSRLCFHSEELAIYAGKQFIDLYNQFLK